MTPVISFRKANLSHLESIQYFLQEEVDKGIILFRDKDEIARNIQAYVLAYQEDTLVALGALHIHSESLGEIRSLMVHQDVQGQGIGYLLIKELLSVATNIQLSKVLVLTYRASLFERLGFELIQKEQIPDQKIWQDCIKCKFFPTKCQEISLIKTI